MRGDGPAHGDIPIDTPRLYRQEQLPRSLPWETVQAFLGGIDRSHTGRRDYAMFLMIATYVCAAATSPACNLATSIGAQESFTFASARRHSHCCYR